MRGEVVRDEDVKGGGGSEREGVRNEDVKVRGESERRGGEVIKA